MGLTLVAATMVTVASCSAGSDSGSPTFTGIGPAILSGPPDGKGLTAANPAPPGVPVDVSGQLALTVLGRPPTTGTTEPVPGGAGTSVVLRFTNASRVDVRIDQSVKLWIQSGGRRLDPVPCPPGVEALPSSGPVAAKQTVAGTMCFEPAGGGSDSVLVTEPVTTPNAEVDRRYFVAP